MVRDALGDRRLRQAATRHRVNLNAAARRPGSLAFSAQPGYRSFDQAHRTLLSSLTRAVVSGSALLNIPKLPSQ